MTKRLLAIALLLHGGAALAKRPVPKETPPCVGKSDRSSSVVSAALEPDGKHTSFCLRIEDRPPSCWRVDLDTGTYVPVPTTVKGEHLKQYVRDPSLPTLEAVPGGVRVCKPGGIADCHVITTVTEENLWRVVVNRAATLLAVGKGDTLTTFDVATGQPLAHLDTDGLLAFLDDTLLVVGYCAGPCGATLYDPRSGKELGEVGGGNTTASYGVDAAPMKKGLWALWEFGSIARTQVDDFSLVLHDSATGALVKRLKFSALKINVDSEVALLGLPAGGLVVLPGSPSAGDVVILDADTQAPTKHFTPPRCAAGSRDPK